MRGVKKQNRAELLFFLNFSFLGASRYQKDAMDIVKSHLGIDAASVVKRFLGLALIRYWKHNIREISYADADLLLLFCQDRSPTRAMLQRFCELDAVQELASLNISDKQLLYDFRELLECTLKPPFRERMANYLMGRLRSAPDADILNMKLSIELVPHDYKGHQWLKQYPWIYVHVSLQQTLPTDDVEWFKSLWSPHCMSEELIDNILSQQAWKIFKWVIAHAPNPIEIFQNAVLYASDIQQIREMETLCHPPPTTFIDLIGIRNVDIICYLANRYETMTMEGFISYACHHSLYPCAIDLMTHMARPYTIDLQPECVYRLGLKHVEALYAMKPNMFPFAVDKMFDFDAIRFCLRKGCFLSCCLLKSTCYKHSSELHRASLRKEIPFDASHIEIDELIDCTNEEWEWMSKSIRDPTYHQIRELSRCNEVQVSDGFPREFFWELHPSLFPHQVAFLILMIRSLGVDPSDMMIRAFTIYKLWLPYVVKAVERFPVTFHSSFLDIEGLEQSTQNLMFLRFEQVRDCLPRFQVLKRIKMQ